ncbi:MAG: succinate dehydrogenase, cytochrome b556 subunit [Burkholderiales bacterium]|nr:succinate dehydrogenase, cytochrome b556 subunit [Burkholderiales bacterium]
MAEFAAKRKRPVYLDVVRIRLPLPGFVSILHRISGAALFVSAFWLLWLLDASLASEGKFDAMRAVAAQPFAKLVLTGLAWGFLHHFCAGIRYLFLDADLGVDLARARASSWAVLAVSIALTALVGGWIWWR